MNASTRASHRSPPLCRSLLPEDSQYFSREEDDEHPTRLRPPAVSFVLLLHSRPLFRSRTHSTRTRATMTKLRVTCYSFRHGTPTKVCASPPLTIPPIRRHSASPFSAVRPRYRPSASYKRFEAKRLAGDVSERLGRFGRLCELPGTTPVRASLDGKPSRRSPYSLQVVYLLLASLTLLFSFSCTFSTTQNTIAFPVPRSS